MKLFKGVPAYKFDCLLRRVNMDRYDDRLTIRTNLIDAYDQMMGFVEKHMNDPFYLEGDLRVSLREKVFRGNLMRSRRAHTSERARAPAVHPVPMAEATGGSFTIMFARNATNGSPTPGGSDPLPPFDSC